MGSSPLARGTLGDTPITIVGNGLIPAGAGNTPIYGEDREIPGAHPRWRGEHPVRKFMNGSHTGSSPLARGTRG